MGLHFKHFDILNGLKACLTTSFLLYPRLEVECRGLVKIRTMDEGGYNFSIYYLLTSLNDNKPKLNPVLYLQFIHWPLAIGQVLDLLDENLDDVGETFSVLEESKFRQP